MEALRPSQPEGCKYALSVLYKQDITLVTQRGSSCRLGLLPATILQIRVPCQLLRAGTCQAPILTACVPTATTCLLRGRTLRRYRLHAVVEYHASGSYAGLYTVSMGVG